MDYLGKGEVLTNTDLDLATPATYLAPEMQILPGEPQQKKVYFTPCDLYQGTCLETRLGFLG